MARGGMVAADAPQHPVPTDRALCAGAAADHMTRKQAHPDAHCTCSTWVTAGVSTSHLVATLLTMNNDLLADVFVQVLNGRPLTWPHDHAGLEHLLSKVIAGLDADRRGALGDLVSGPPTPCPASEEDDT
jgi:hypothetical protein